MGKWWMSRIRIRTIQIQNRVREFSAVFLVEVTNPQENLRDDVLVKPRLARRWNGRIFPCHPARRIGHAAIFFGETRAWQAVNRGLNVLLFFGRNSRCSPELAGLVLIN